MFAPKFQITNKILRNISTIEAVEEVIKHAPILPLWEKDFREDAIVRSVHHGTHIEGNKLEKEEAYDVLRGKDSDQDQECTGDPRHDPSIREDLTSREHQEVREEEDQPAHPAFRIDVVSDSWDRGEKAQAEEAEPQQVCAVLDDLCASQQSPNEPKKRISESDDRKKYLTGGDFFGSTKDVEMKENDCHEPQRWNTHSQSGDEERCQRDRKDNLGFEEGEPRDTQGRKGDEEQPPAIQCDRGITFEERWGEGVHRLSAGERLLDEKNDINRS